MQIHPESDFCFMEISGNICNIVLEAVCVIFHSYRKLPGTGWSVEKITSPFAADNKIRSKSMIMTNV